MATVYIITNTEGTNVFAIQPGTLNGPGGVQSNTDLRLYGMGSALWGEGVNENFVRLAESFATPEKGGSPGNPQDSGDLGPGNGVNNPLTGQLWFNLSSESLMVWDGTIWKTTGGTSFGTTPPTSPQDGDLWYDDVTNQLMVYDGGWVSVAERYLLLDGTIPMAGNIDFDNTYHAINMIDPVADQDAATKKYVDDEILSLTSGGGLDGLYVNITGDTMIGDLTMGANLINFTNVVINEGNGQIAVAPDIRSSAEMLLASDGGIHFNLDGDNTGTGFFSVNKGQYTVDGGETRLFTIEYSGRVVANTTSYETLVTTNNSIPNKKYVDDEIASLSGGGGNFCIIDPVSPKDGDVRVTTPGVIEMRQDSIWRQVYPALYS